MLDAVNSWPPAQGLRRLIPVDTWPADVATLVHMVLTRTSSVYDLLLAREVVESLLLAAGRDRRAAARLRQLPHVERYLQEPVDRLLDALGVLNDRIDDLGLDEPLDVTPVVLDGDRF